MTDEIGNQRATAEQVVIGKPCGCVSTAASTEGFGAERANITTTNCHRRNSSTTRGNSAHEQSETEGLGIKLLASQVSQAERCAMLLSVQ
jgi:hypothetical protein